MVKSLSLILISLLIMIVLSDDADTECSRHRKPWHMISDDERMQFVSGFQQLRNNGVLATFAETHHLEGIAFEDIHKTSEFFFWHSYFVWEVETQFRNLGEEYACFSMPYWDITNDAKYLEDDALNIENLPIFNSFIGGDGNIDNNNCVEDELWNLGNYQTEFLCTEDEISPNCCLKRQVNYDVDRLQISGLANMSEITTAILKFHRFREFQDIVSYYHGKVHKFFAYNNESHMWSNNAAEDPIFVLLHSFVDYIRSMREDCWEYDKLGLDELDEYIPFAFDCYEVDESGVPLGFKPMLDTAMGFAYICDHEWSHCHNTDITVRKMFDIQQWGISYEPGTFWNENDELKDVCNDKLNDTWFYEENLMKQRIINDVGNKDEYGFSTLMSLIYVIIGTICGVFFIYVIIRQYVYYMKDSREMMEKLIQINIRNNDRIHDRPLSLYGTV